MRTGYFVWLVYFYSITSGVEAVEDFQGIKIDFNHQKYQEQHKLEIIGSFAMFINCGSQYAIWSQFPDVIRYSLTDLDSKTTYQSIDNELSISWDGNEVYDRYASEPCDKIVEKTFSMELANVYFQDAPKDPITNWTLSAFYLGYESNLLTFNHTSLILKSF